MVSNFVAERYFKNKYFRNSYQNPWKIFLGKGYKNNYSKKIISVCEYNNTL